MMNLSCLSKTKLFAVASIASIAIGTGALFVVPSQFQTYVALGYLSLASVFSILTWISVNRTQKLLKEAASVCENIANGNFEHRMRIGVHKGGETRIFIDRLNNAIDLTDAFIRESYLAMKAASEGRYYRKIREEGMRGAFLTSVRGINGEIDAMAVRQSLTTKAIEQAKELASQAAVGNIDGRIDESQFTGKHAELAGAMNDLMAAIEAPLREANTVISRLAKSDLTQRIDGEYHGSFSRLKRNINTLAEGLSSIMGTLGTTSGNLKSTTGEILAGSNDLSDRTMRQASAIEETSASMEQLSSTVSENAKYARSAQSNATNTHQIAAKGGEVMRNANEAMHRITASSNKISEIIGLIDDIAFQTNLLALNASVEAARAGEAGKGFAVVAIEVRRLAQSAAGASSDVKQLIETSVNEINEGSGLVSEAAENLEQIVTSVNEMSEQMNSIATTSQDQALSIDELSEAVRQMDEMTQQNAALVEETNAAIEESENRATEVDNIVGTFKTSGYSKALADNAEAA